MEVDIFAEPEPPVPQKSVHFAAAAAAATAAENCGVIDEQLLSSGSVLLLLLPPPAQPALAEPALAQAQPALAQAQPALTVTTAVSSKTKKSRGVAKRQNAENTIAQAKAAQRAQVSRFKREMTTHIDYLRTVQQNRERDISVRLSSEELKVRRDQVRVATIVNKHASLSSQLEKKLKKLKKSKSKNFNALREMMLELTGSVKNLHEDMSMVEKQHAQRLKLRKDDLRALQKTETDVLKLRTAVMVQLDQFVNVEVPQAAAQPWAVSGFGNRFMRSLMERPATRPARSYRSQIVGDLEDQEAAEKAEARELMELEDAERSARIPPPAGFYTDTISVRNYALLAQQTARNADQRLGMPIISAMAAPAAQATTTTTTVSQ